MMANDVSKAQPKYNVKLFQKIARPEDKKIVLIKEISKVLNEIEDAKKTRKIIYFSHMYKKPVLDPTGRKVGYLKDLAISGGERFPEVSHLHVASHGEEFMVPWQSVKSFNDVIVLDKPMEMVEKRKVADDIFLGEHILDKQVVDVNGLKVIRVNDIALTYIKNKLAVVDIDIGSRSLLRRIGLEKLANLLPWQIKDHPVPWDSIEPLGKSVEKIHLKVPCPRVADLHPADVAELFEELSLRERTRMLRAMKRETAAKVLLECESDVCQRVLNSLKTKRIAGILEKMSANDAANLISEHPKLDRILKAMEISAADRVRRMLSYKAGTVARYMNEYFVAVKSDLTVGQTIGHIRKLPRHPENFYYVYVLDENGTLCGVVSLKQLILQEPKKCIRDIMISKIISLEAVDPVEYAEELMTKYDLMSLPVTDSNGQFAGIIDIDDILDVVIERSKSNQPFELTDEQKEDIRKEKRLKRYYSALIKDVGQFLRDLEGIAIRKDGERKNQGP
jgi:CBS domain-containing protein